ncbi:MFS transporter [Xylanibacillus composti]|uniref:MFS transporter n=2 Tax=Xylanibacillus composti TaxID=1572762 RepID=A0A8J4H6L2_9BACL|nr:MFS transporter [Xylanibacillus composti]GIQ69438.1 MFS transporter [Xylanibacillus composti]
MEAGHRKRNLPLLLFSRTVSELGTSMFSFVLGLYVLEMTGSALKYSFILTAAILGRVVANSLAGIAADRYDKKHLILWAEYGSAAVLVLLWALHAWQELSWISALAGTVLISMLGSLLRVTLNSSVPELLDETAAQKANALFQTIGALALIGGPLLGAVAYSETGLTTVIVLNVITFVGSGLVLLLLRFPQVSELPLPGGAWAEMRATWTYIRGYAHLYEVLKISAIMNFILYPMMMLVLPFVIYQVLRMSETELAAIQACWAAGMVAGTLFLVVFKRGDALIRHFFHFLIVLGLLVFLWAYPGLPGIDAAVGAGDVGVYGALVFLIGFLQMLVQVPMYTYFQFRISLEMRGKVWGLANTLTDVSAPFGLWACGLLLDGISWVWVPLVSGAAIVLISAWMKTRFGQDMRIKMAGSEWEEGTDCQKA